METSSLTSLPDDLLRPVLRLIDAHDLCHLIFCGQVSLNQRIFRPDIVSALSYRPKDPLKAKWPSLIHSLPSLLELDICMPEYYEHMPLLLSGECCISPSLTKLSMTCGNANQLFDARTWSKYPHMTHVYLDGMRAPRPNATIGPSMQSIAMKGYSIQLVDFGCLTEIDTLLFLSVADINRLPPTLTSIKTLNVIIPSKDPEELEELSNALILPPCLLTLDISFEYSNLSLFNRLPRSITDLKATAPRKGEEETYLLSFPPGLVSLTLYGVKYPITSFFPPSLKKLKCFVPHESFEALPTSITHLSIYGPHIPPSTLALIPCTNLRHLKCRLTNEAVTAMNCPLPQLISQKFSYGPVFPFQSLPNALMTLECNIKFLEPFLPGLPNTLTHLTLKVNETSECDNWPHLLPQSIETLSVTIPRGELNTNNFQWPTNLRHLTINGFVAPPTFWDFPPSLLSLDIGRSRLLDTEVVLSHLPTSLTSFTMHELKIIDEDIPRLPPRLVTLQTNIDISIQAVSNLPKTLNVVATFRKAIDPLMDDLAPEYCTLIGPRTW